MRPRETVVFSHELFDLAFVDREKTFHIYCLPKNNIHQNLLGF